MSFLFIQNILFFLSSLQISTDCQSRVNGEKVLEVVSGSETRAMRRRKRTDIFKLCALCFSTITLINLISECSAGATIHLEERMEVVRKVLREVPLIDG